MRSTGAPAYGYIKRSADWVIDARMLSAELDPVSYMTVQEAAIESAQQWRWKPALRDGEPIEATA